MLYVFIDQNLWNINNDERIEDNQVDNLLEFLDEIKAIDRQKTVLSESSMKHFIDNTFPELLQIVVEN